MHTAIGVCGRHGHAFLCRHEGGLWCSRPLPLGSPCLRSRVTGQEKRDVQEESFESLSSSLSPIPFSGCLLTSLAPACVLSVPHGVWSLRDTAQVTWERLGEELVLELSCGTPHVTASL